MRVPLRRAEETSAARGRQTELAKTSSSAHRAIATVPHVEVMLRLQQSVGNRSVQRLLRNGGAVGQAPTSEVEDGIRRTRGSGAALHPARQAEMEQAFGADFSGVRIHTDAEADALSDAVSAVAFTTGQDIYFRRGAYEPDAPAGRRLLAHELTHVVQQSGTVTQGSLSIGPVDDGFEREAEQVAASFIEGADRSASGDPAPGLPTSATVQRMCAECEEEQMP